MTQGAVRIWRPVTRKGSGAERLLSIALFVFAGSMAIMALHALIIGDIVVSTVFGISASGCCLLASALRMILRRYPIRAARSGLLVLLIFYAVGPFIAALPLIETVPGFTLMDAYFEMSSAITTTGASTVWNIDAVPNTVLLWRSTVAGLGGFVCLAAAVAILAPLSIGGFEIHHGAVDKSGHLSHDNASTPQPLLDRRNVTERMIWASRQLIMPYVGFIILGALGLAASGAPAFEALCLALGVVSTTGFTLNEGGIAAYGSLPVEIILVLIMIPAAIGVGVHLQATRGRFSAYLHDPEIRYMAIAVGAVVALLFLRHWIGAIETSSTDELEAGISALWGAIFMAVSYVTTTGFESAAWDGATAWSGLRTPGVALIGLAIVGGGAASTAGGVKLLRAALLAKHSINELGRLTRPTEVRPVVSGTQRVTHRAMRIVFVFVMLYILAVVASALALTATGIGVEEALIASISVLSNTGPLMPLIEEDTNAYLNLPALGKAVLCVGMVVGRMETLAVVALLNPITWRK